MEKTPYIHAYTAGLEAMGLLAHGSTAAVFLTIGWLMPTQPHGVSIDDIAKYTGLGKRAISPALEILLSNGLISKVSPDNYTAVKYLEYRKPMSDTHNVRVQLDDSINRQSKSNQSHRQSSNTEEQFIISLRALAQLLLASGGLNPR